LGCERREVGSGSADKPKLQGYCPGMIWNIIDNRTRPYRWAHINAIIEAAWHDNSCADTDIAPDVDLENEVTYEQRECISLHDAINWANNQACPVTLYLYDLGKGAT